LRFAFLLFAITYLSPNLYAQNRDKLDSLTEALEKAQKGKTKNSEIVDLLIEISDTYYPNKLTEAEENARRALELARELDYVQGIANSYYALAKVTSKLNRPDQALELYFTSLEFYDDLEDPRLADIFNNIGILYKNKGQYQMAFDYYKRAFEIYKVNNDQRGIARILVNMGVIFRRQSNHQQAIEFYMKALKQYDLLNDNPGVSYVYFNLGNIYLDQKDHERALEFFNKAFIGYDKINDPHTVSILLNNMGLTYKGLNEHDIALNYFEKAYEKSEKFEYENGMALALSNIGEIHIEQKNFDEGLNIHKKSLSIFKELGNKAYEANLLINIGSIQLKLGELDSAIQNINKGLNIAQNIGSKEIKLEGLKLLYKYYQEVDDLEKTLEAYWQYNVIKDTLFNIEKAKQIAQIESRYEIEKREQENEILNQKIQRKNLENTALLAGIVLVMLFAVYFYYTMRQKKRTNQLLASQNREINQKQEEIITINENLLDSQRKLNQANAELQNLNQTLESKVKQRTQALRQANRELDTFLYQSSHALRRPILSIMGLIHLAGIETNKIRISEAVDKIETVLNGMDMMLRKLVMASEINMAKIKKEKVDFNAVLFEIKQELQSLIESKNIQFKWQVNPKISYKGNPRYLNIILHNLIENAVNFQGNMGDNDPSVQVEVQNINSHLEIKVHDNGPGIPSEGLDKIYEMFSVATDRTPGYGLGLYLVKKAVDKLKGKISIDSQEQEGTTVQVSLPL